MDVRGTAPVYIPPILPPKPISVSPTTQMEKRVGLKIRIAFMLTLFFVVLQLHPVYRFLDAAYNMIFQKPFELANEYGCSTAKGTVFTAIVFFILAIVWLKPLV